MINTAIKNKLLIALLTLLVATQVFSQQKAKPNILFIAVDDLKPQLFIFFK